MNKVLDALNHLYLCCAFTHFTFSFIYLACLLTFPRLRFSEMTVYAHFKHGSLRRGRGLTSMIRMMIFILFILCVLFNVIDAAKGKDYYKILGVSKKFTEKELKKAYRYVSRTILNSKVKCTNKGCY